MEVFGLCEEAPEGGERREKVATPDTFLLLHHRLAHMYHQASQTEKGTRENIRAGD